jgi:hypothetical protein
MDARGRRRRRRKARAASARRARRVTPTPIFRDASSFARRSGWAHLKSRRATVLQGGGAYRKRGEVVSFSACRHASRMVASGPPRRARRSRGARTHLLADADRDGLLGRLDVLRHFFRERKIGIEKVCVILQLLNFAAKSSPHPLGKHPETRISRRSMSPPTRLCKNTHTCVLSPNARRPAPRNSIANAAPKGSSAQARAGRKN